MIFEFMLLGAAGTAALEWVADGVQRKRDAKDLSTAKQFRFTLDLNRDEVEVVNGSSNADRIRTLFSKGVRKARLADQAKATGRTK